MILGVPILKHFRVFIQVIWLRVVVKVVLNPKITDPMYLWSVLSVTYKNDNSA